MTAAAASMDAAAVWPSGRVQMGRARPDRVQSAQDAIDALAHGAVCVYVAREDVALVKLAATTMPHAGNALAAARKDDAERVRDGETVS